MALTYAVMILLCSSLLYYGFSEFLVLYAADINHNYDMLENMIELNCDKEKTPSANARQDLKEKFCDLIQFHSDSIQLSQTIFLSQIYSFEIVIFVLFFFLYSEGWFNNVRKHSYQ